MPASRSSPKCGAAFLTRIGRPDRSQRLFLSFSSGHLAKSLIWSFSDLLFGYFAHTQMGLPASDVGWIIFVSMIFSGVLDVLAASLFSAFPGHESKAPRLQLIGAVLTALASLLLFTPLPISGDVLFYWLLASSLLFRAGYALYDITQNALVSLLPRGDSEAERYVTARTTLSYVAKVIVALASFVVIGAGDRQGSALTTILPVAVMMLAAAYPMSKHRIDEHRPDASVQAGGSAPPLPLLWPVLAAVAAQICLLGLIGRFLPFAKDPLTGSPVGAPLVLASVAGGVLGPLVAGRMVRDARGFALANIGFTTICVGSALAILFGRTTTQLVAAAAIFSVGGGAISVLVWNSLSAIVRTHAMTSGRRSDLASFALLTATIKLGAGCSGLLMGYFLDGYEAHSMGVIGAMSAVTIAGGLLSILGMAFGDRQIRRCR